MGVEGEEPTASEIIEIRSQVSQFLEDQGQDVFLPQDRQRIFEEDHFVKRFFMHVYDLSGDQVINAYNMVIKALQWRKENQVNEIKSSTLNPALKEKGSLFVHNRDKDGKKMLVFAVKKHVKGVEDRKDLKQFFLYFLEKVDREDNGDMLTLVFDCADCSLKNMDMDLIQYMINVFKEYYPWNLNYILVFEMPWVLNAAWKIIKTWLPSGAVKKIKFLNKTNIREYVNEDQLLPSWGGTETWEYAFEEEKVTTESVLKSNGKKSVMFSDDCKENGHTSTVSDLDSSDSMARSKPATNGESETPPAVMAKTAVVELNPPKDMLFSFNEHKELGSKVEIKNVSKKIVAFKIKTTCPDKFRVRPSTAVIQCGEAQTVDIYVTTPFTRNMQDPSLLSHEKFLISVISLDNKQEHDIPHLFQSQKPEVQYRLWCTYQVRETPSTPSSVVEKVNSADRRMLQQILNEQKDVKQLLGRMHNLLVIWMCISTGLVLLNIFY